jgi:hypothetical protein
MKHPSTSHQINLTIDTYHSTHMDMKRGYVIRCIPSLATLCELFEHLFKRTCHRRVNSVHWEQNKSFCYHFEADNERSTTEFESSQYLIWLWSYCGLKMYMPVRNFTGIYLYFSGNSATNWQLVQQFDNDQRLALMHDS